MLVLSYNTKNIEVTDCQFLDNHNLSPAPLSNSGAVVETNLHTGLSSGNAGLSLFTMSAMTNITIRYSHFRNNTASENDHGEVGQLSLRPYGRGSAILIRLVETHGSSVEISNCVFTENHAQVEGAAVYLSLSENSSSNEILLRGNDFRRNTVELGTGGALALNSFRLSMKNRVDIWDNMFSGNGAISGGAVSFSLYDSNEESVLQPDTLHFHNCSFEGNSALHEGTAVGLFSLLHVEHVGFLVHFSDW